MFVYLLLGTHAYGWAVAVLMISGASDWADGKLARLLDQYSRLGELLDPAVDRLYMLVVPVSIAIAGIVPWWVIVVLIVRDGLLAADAAGAAQLAACRHCPSPTSARPRRSR